MSNQILKNKKYDVAILGAGTAGLSARKEVAKMTQNYIIIDPGPLGTTCARVGCMPSKAFIQVANDYHRKKIFSDVGILGSEKISIDTQKVMNHVRQLRDRFVNSVLEGIEEWSTNHLIQKRAHFMNMNTLDLEGEEVIAEKIIIATGSQIKIPKQWEKYKSYILNSDNLFDLKQLPSKVAVIGLGTIGLEIGQALSRLGVDVIGIDHNQSIGGLTNPKLSESLIETFSEEFPIYFDGVEILDEADKGLRIKSGQMEAVFEKVFLSLGRKHNLESLHLEKTGVQFNSDNIPFYDIRTGRVKDSSLYLAGDVNAHRPILHEAAYEGYIAGYNSVREEDKSFPPKTAIKISFTDPNIAIVGQSYKELKAKKIKFLTGSINFKNQGRALIKSENQGMLQVYAAADDGQLLGAEIFAPEGEHLAHQLAWFISLDLKIDQILDLPFYHPVLEEGLRTAFQHVSRQLVSRS